MPADVLLDFAHDIGREGLCGKARVGGELQGALLRVDGHVGQPYGVVAVVGCRAIVGKVVGQPCLDDCGLGRQRLRE